MRAHAAVVYWTVHHCAVQYMQVYGTVVLAGLLSGSPGPSFYVMNVTHVDDKLIRREQRGDFLLEKHLSEVSDPAKVRGAPRGLQGPLSL